MKNKYLKIIFVYVVLFLSCSSTNSQNKLTEEKSKNHNIQIEIDNLDLSKDPNQIYFLVNNFGTQHYKKDSCKVQENKKFVFKSDSILEEGMYKLLVNDSTYYEFIVGKNQVFKISADAKDYLNSVKVENSLENTLFFDYLKYVNEQGNKFESFRLSRSGNDELINQKFQEMEKLASDFRKNIIKTYPNLTVTVFMKILEEQPYPDIDPKLPVEEQRKIYLAALKDYFKNIDFTDKRILRFLFMANRFENYIEKILQGPPNEIIPIIVHILDQTKPSPENFRWFTLTALKFYGKGDYIGQDDVFSELSLRYVTKELMPWMEEGELYRSKDEALILQKTKIGAKAPELYLKDFNGRQFSLMSFNAKYVLIMFYNPNCHHCQESAPKVVDILEKGNYNSLKFIAVNISDEPEKWGDFVKKNFSKYINLADFKNEYSFRQDYGIKTIPKFVLLDEQKRIIVKNFNVEILKEILDDNIK